MSLARHVALRPTGKRAARWAKWQDSQRKLVLRRARYTCESCGRGELGVQPDWHHSMGRGAQVAEPWASSVALTLALCRREHTEWHDGKISPNVHEALLWTCADRLAGVIGEQEPTLRTQYPHGGLARDRILSLVRLADERGITPPGYVALGITRENNDSREQP